MNIFQSALESSAAVRRKKELKKTQIDVVMKKREKESRKMVEKEWVISL